MVGQRGPGADEAHVAFQDVDKLRELVDGGLPDDLSHPGQAGVVMVAVDAAAGVLRVHHHRPELQHGVFPVMKSQPGLPENNGALGVQPDRQGGNQADRRQDDEGCRGDDDVQESFDPSFIHCIPSLSCLY